FWKQELEQFASISLPSLTASRPPCLGFHSIQQIIDVNQSTLETLQNDLKITFNTIFRAAWAITVYFFTRNDSVLFGSISSGRDSGIENIESCAGLFISTIPVPVRISQSQTLFQLLDQLQRFHVRSLPHTHSSLIDIRKWASIPGDLFQSIISFQNFPDNPEKKESVFEMKMINSDDHTDYPLLLTTTNANGLFEVRLEFDSSRIHSHMAQKIILQFQ
ncbi:hypothetical protein BC833DRAFT_513073, partial [Globomyces pollinis-pini]